MILPRTKPCRKECPTPKKLEGYRSGHRRQYNPYHDHKLWLQYATIEERSQPTRAYIIYTTYLFCTIFLINLLLPLGYLLHTPPPPPIFLFSRLIFTTPFLRLTLTTPFHDSCSQPPFATRCFMTTPLCDPTTDGQTVSTPLLKKPLLMIGLISSCLRSVWSCAVLSPSQRIASLHVSFTAYEYFYRTI